MRRSPTLALLFLTVLSLAESSSDSLRGALEALNRRQRALQYSPRPYVNGANLGRYRYPVAKKEGEDEDEELEFLPLEPGQPEDIGYGYQKGVQMSHGATPAQLERLLMEYLMAEDKGEEKSQDNEEDERWSSFRERGDDEEMGDEEMKRAPPSSLFRERQRVQARKRSPETQERYLQLLAALWNKYEREADQQQQQGQTEESMEKRQDGYGYDFFNSPMGWGQGHFDKAKRGGAAESDPWFPAFELVPRERNTASKRFPVSKRSSGGAPLSHKKGGNKVAAELAEIFTGSKMQNNQTHNSTEVSTASTAPQPVVHKKSIDWSQYFGIDRRRKKSTDAEVKDEKEEKEIEQRLMDQYYRTLALATTVKRKRSEPPAAEVALEGMEQKLRAMEDLIVDEAVKFTGAHQGSSDPQEVRVVKDKVLSRLAAAYSLEKMRQALDEFRSSLGPDTSSPSGTKGEEHEGTSSETALPAAEKRMTSSCPELRLLAAHCRVHSVLAEACIWHRACHLCGAAEGEVCDAGFMHEAEESCEGHGACLHNARRIVSSLSRADVVAMGDGRRCEPCLVRFLEISRR